MRDCPCKKDSKTRTVRFLPQLKKLLRCNQKERCKQLECANECLISYLIDAVSALLRTDIRVAPEQYKKLKKHRDLLLFLARKKTSVREKKKKLLNQKGGLAFLPLLLPALISGIAGFIGKNL